MISNSYDAMVQMKPEMENRDFFTGDDDFTYQMPRVYFECWGEVHNLQSALDWEDTSVITFKDNCAVKYTECNYYQILVKDESGNDIWIDGKFADYVWGDIDDAIRIRPIKSYIVEEFDWNTSEKRRYKVILEETSKLEEYDEGYLKKVIARDSKGDDGEYILTQS